MDYEIPTNLMDGCCEDLPSLFGEDEFDDAWDIHLNAWL